MGIQCHLAAGGEGWGEGSFTRQDISSPCLAVAGAIVRYGDGVRRAKKPEFVQHGLPCLTEPVNELYSRHRGPG
jgi:hypothetical protein